MNTPDHNERKKFFGKIAEQVQSGLQKGQFTITQSGLPRTLPIREVPPEGRFVNRKIKILPDHQTPQNQ